MDIKESDLIENLISNGFKQLENVNHVLINHSGLVYNIKKRDYLKPYKNKKGYLLLTIGVRVYNLAKLLKDTFSDELNKTNYVRFVDNNKENLNLDNIEYCNLSDFQKGIPKNTNPCQKRKQSEITPSKLANVYKFYTDIEENSLKTLLSTEIQRLQFESMILSIRNETKDKYLRMIVFIEYTNSITIEAISNKYSLSVSKTKDLIKQARKQLINDIKTDIKTGIIKEPIKEPLKTQTLAKRLKTFNSEYGSSIPLRKKSKNELIKDFAKFKNEIEAEK